MKICLYGASSNEIDPKYIAAVERLGYAPGKRGHTLLFGGGAQGLMGAAARGCKDGGGRIIGVAPSFFNVDGILYPHCDSFIYTETMRERKQILEDRADGFVTVPGGIGTFDEFFEILTLKQLGRHAKPIALFNVEGYFDPLLALLENSIEKGFLKAACRSLWSCFDDPDALLDRLEHEENDPVDVRRMKNI